jgi:hypothetical protein
VVNNFRTRLAKYHAKPWGTVRNKARESNNMISAEKSAGRGFECAEFLAIAKQARAQMAISGIPAKGSR